MSDCVEPNAPWVQCMVCFKPLKTCERTEPINNSYICPVHNDGAQQSDGSWICAECYYGEV